MRHTMKKILAATFSVLLFTGCTTFETVSPQTPEAQEILAFNAPQEGAALYVYRDRKSHYGGFEMILDVDDKEISLAGACLKRIELAAGTYHLKANHPDLQVASRSLILLSHRGTFRSLNSNRFQDLLYRASQN